MLGQRKATRSSFAQAGGAQGGGEAIDPLLELSVAVRRSPVAVDDGGLVREDGGATAQETNRVELGRKTFCLVEVADGDVGVLGELCDHGRPPCRLHGRDPS